MYATNFSLPIGIFPIVSTEIEAMQAPITAEVITDNPAHLDTEKTAIKESPAPARSIGFTHSAGICCLNIEFL